MIYRILCLCIFIINFSTITEAQNVPIKEDNFKIRVAVADVQSILEGSIAIKDLRNKIEKLNHKIQEDIAAKEAEFKPLEEKLLNERSNLSETEFEHKVNEFNAKVSHVRKEIQIKKTKLEQAHAEAMSRVHGTTITIISELAEKYNLNLVIPSAQVLYAKNNLNITSEVTFMLNERLKEVTINY
ncbi:MAG: OmpH family outer membrane protein [Rickettsia endosymbiont of Ixodes persulcatus]|nr:OmpH family outer membrane protein [Rickettsia endosymbiont of Ixodes persulcatus]MCZ6902674.1 OmpH family outer membrane protein [Rickettsia endosymbiont of Ixodes persulcatus]MCZ6909241.1 OmpH family outer membrane protein [Rickettsia endosymbiont of Ixodes persulcatus]MCZ6911145.1 OmpH family outer membrane protein [Rickettsia endosymbiont of Ixodes persulcatus]MCZ6915105.1 OmpH family outer membrane protein [Rickettsia endosymbiont of Ixodes persulcatus]